VVLAVLGPRVALVVALPLGMGVFLVPFGDEIIPPLQMITAAMAIALTQWSGVAAEIDGINIYTPAGWFIVAEACSGVRFLIAMVALAVLMPIVAGIGGNAGTQTLAVTVRALATNQLTASNTWRAVRREISIAALNGATVALVIALAVTLIFSNAQLGMVIGLAMACNILIAGFAGVFVPLTLQRMKADPAIASSIFVTMTTDSMGFLVFLGLAVASGLVG